MRNTSRPPPESLAIVSVKVVEVAEPIRAARTNTHIESAEVAFVEASAVQFVYVPPPPELLSVITGAWAVVRPEWAAMTTIRSPAAGVATTVLFPAVVLKVFPADVTAAI
jgi:hypothetical protein